MNFANFSAQSSWSSIFLGNFFQNLTSSEQQLKPLNFHDGNLVKNTGDTLIGSIKLSSRKRPLSITFKKENRDTVIKIKDIKLVNLFSQDSTLFETKNTFYCKLDGETNKLYRLLYDGSLKIYDGAYYCNENIGFIGDDFLVYENGKKVLSISANTLNAISTAIQFVNTKYVSNFSSNDIQKAKEIIPLLIKLDKASSKL